MLNSKGFDLWADGYDKAVGLSDEDGTYPFAGYRDVLGGIYSRIMQKPGASVLDLGFGTGTLTVKLYEQGCRIFGQDFSPRMIEIASGKMPEACLFEGDFSKELAGPLLENRYDFIVATYALHHLTDGQKRSFIPGLLSLLEDDGMLLIGDVAFSDKKAMDECREAAGDEWDDEEYYFITDEAAEYLPGLVFEKKSHCAGIIMVTAGNEEDEQN
jgi:putative AdoMet-dependent methyltransferase